MKRFLKILLGLTILAAAGASVWFAALEGYWCYLNGKWSVESIAFVIGLLVLSLAFIAIFSHNLRWLFLRSVEYREARLTGAGLSN